MLKRSVDSSDSGLRNQFPKRLKTVASNVTFSEGNHLLHRFVLDNSSPNDSGSENYINAVLLSMCDTSVNALNNEGYCAIHLAVLKNNILMVAKMLSCLETLQVNIKDKHKNTALHLATTAGHVLIMQELLNNGADVNARSYEDRTPLHLALQGDNLNLDIITLLLERGAKLNVKDEDGDTALHLAAKTGHVLIIQELLNNGADVNAQGYKDRAPLHLALQGDNLNLDIITLLLERGANVNVKDEDGDTALHLAAKTGHVLIIQELLNNGADVNAQGYEDRTPLHLASERDGVNLDIITLLLERGANVNVKDEDGYTALHLAAKTGHVLIIQVLLNNGADVNAINQYYDSTLFHLALEEDGLNLDVITLLLETGAIMNAQDTYNNTALHLATKASHVQIMQELLNKGADVNAKCGFYNRTPLHLALQGDNLNLDIITLLLERGANVNAQDTFNNTALHLATKAGHVPIMQNLLNLDADVNAQCRFFNRTPLHLALQGDNLNLDVITLLLERGANMNVKDIYGNTALHLVTKVGLIPNMQELLNNADIKSLLNKHCI